MCLFIIEFLSFIMVIMPSATQANFVSDYIIELYIPCQLFGVHSPLQ